MSVVAQLADELLDVVNEHDPLVATLGGFRERDGLLRDCSEAGEAALVARLAEILARAADLAGLSVDDQLTCAVIRAYGGAVADQLTVRSVEYTITPLYYAPACQLLFGLPMIGISEPAHAEGYLARLRSIPQMLATLADRHRAGVRAGRLPVRRLVDATVAYLDRYLANQADNPLRRPEVSPSAERDRLIDGVVRTAFERYRAVLADEIAAHGRPDDRAGLCWLPHGEATYVSLIRAHTTVARSAEELHRTGLDLVEQIGEEFRSVGERVFGPISLPELFERLRTVRSGSVMATAHAAIARAHEAAPQWFGRLPCDPFEIRAVSPDQAPDAPGGNYLRAALDGSRPAIYFVNAQADYTAEAVAFHETIPGHHVQVGLAQELPDLPRLRRIAPINAFAEGWGLYAERLADEMGLYSDDVARLGMLAGDSIRAARLIADTGIHALGWDRARAVDYLRTHTPMPDTTIDQETDRYIADPGQALAYMTGRLEIDRIRAKAERILGGRFDIRAFHDAVLAHGEIPLGALAGVIDDWISAHP